MTYNQGAPTWNVKGNGGVNKPLHEKMGAPKRAAPPVPSHGPNRPQHQRNEPRGGANKPLHQRVGPPTRNRPPLSGKGKTF